MGRLVDGWVGWWVDWLVGRLVGGWVGGRVGWWMGWLIQGSHRFSILEEKDSVLSFRHEGNGLVIAATV